MGNLGRTSLKCRRRHRDPMREFDRLPPELRRWVGTASLPWRSHSVRQAYDKALLKTRSPVLALLELDQIEARLLAKDARRIWGPDHPSSC